MKEEEIKSLVEKHGRKLCEPGAEQMIEDAVREALAGRPKTDDPLAANLRLLAANQRARTRVSFAACMIDQGQKDRADAESDLLDEAARRLELEDENLYIPTPLFHQRIDAMKKQLDEMTAARDNAVEAIHLMQAGQI